MERTFREYDGNLNLSVSEIGKMHLGALNEVYDNCRVILRTHMNMFNRNGAPSPEEFRDARQTIDRISARLKDFGEAGVRPTWV